MIGIFLVGIMKIPRLKQGSAQIDSPIDESALQSVLLKNDVKVQNCSIITIVSNKNNYNDDNIYQ